MRAAAWLVLGIGVRSDGKFELDAKGCEVCLCCGEGGGIGAVFAEGEELDVDFSAMLEGDAVSGGGVAVGGEFVDVLAGHLLLGGGRAGSYPAGA